MKVKALVTKPKFTPIWPSFVPCLNQVQHQLNTPNKQNSSNSCTLYSDLIVFKGLAYSSIVFLELCLSQLQCYKYIFKNFVANINLKVSIQGLTKADFLNSILLKTSITQKLKMYLRITVIQELSGSNHTLELFDLDTTFVSRLKGFQSIS